MPPHILPLPELVLLFIYLNWRQFYIIRNWFSPVYISPGFQCRSVIILIRNMVFSLSQITMIYSFRCYWWKFVFLGVLLLENVAAVTIFHICVSLHTSVTFCSKSGISHRVCIFKALIAPQKIQLMDPPTSSEWESSFSC